MSTRELQLRVASVVRATPTMRRVRLALGGRAFAYAAGQAITLGLPGHTATVPYSLASSPEESARHDWLELLIKVESSGRWGQRFERLVRGMTLAVRGPYGRFVLPDRPRAHRFVFIAGGSGIAPIRAMIHHLRTHHQRRPLRLLYSARTPGDFAYLTELRALVREGFLDLTLTATREVGPRWRGLRGRIAAERLAPLISRTETMCFVCGPTSMVHEVPLVLRELGVAKGRIRVEEW
jgi:ferredoxin-NADP reductase